MTMRLSPMAGKPADPSQLIDPDLLVKTYFEKAPDPSVPEQRVAFGTSGHRGSPLTTTFNETHILAISLSPSAGTASAGRIDGPLYPRLGHPRRVRAPPSGPPSRCWPANWRRRHARREATKFTPTPAVSHAILTYNRGRRTGLADGIVITPSHNPPEDGGFKYDPPEGGPAESAVTGRIEREANRFFESGLKGVAIGFDRALKALMIHGHDFGLMLKTSAR